MMQSVLIIGGGSMAAVIVPIIAGTAVIISLIADREKTWTGLKTAVKRFLAVLPSFLTMLAAVSIILALISEETIMKALTGGNRFIFYFGLSSREKGRGKFSHLRKGNDYNFAWSVYHYRTSGCLDT